MWCDYCNADIRISGIFSCLRKGCRTKAKVPPGAKVLAWRKRGGSTKADSDGDDGA